MKDIDGESDSLTSILRQCDGYEFKWHEKQQVIDTYRFALFLYVKHVPKPGSIPEHIGYQSNKFREAYKMSQLTIQRTIDEWHKPKY